MQLCGRLIKKKLNVLYSAAVGYGMLQAPIAKCVVMWPDCYYYLASMHLC